MKNNLILLLFVLIALGTFGYFLMINNKINFHKTNEEENKTTINVEEEIFESTEAITTVQTVGGQRDDYGCLIPAGYSYNEDIKACVREWELSEDEREAAKIAVQNSTFSDITIVEIDNRCGSESYYILIQNKNYENEEFTIIDGSVAELEEITLSPEECQNLGGNILNTVTGISCNENDANLGQVTGFISPHVCCKPKDE